MTNREIKFRAWGSDNGATPEMIDIIEGDYYNASRLIGWYNAGKNWVIMQYTGLKDKHGEEIYEGDIVMGHFGDEDDYDFPTPNVYMVGEVYWDYVGFSFKVVAGDPHRVGMVNYFPFYDGSDFFTDMEVVGNIYENPELLE